MLHELELLGGELVAIDGAIAKLAALMAKRAAAQADLAQLTEAGETQLSRTDADARLLKKHGQTVAGYNVQVAIDAKHKLIVASEVVNDGNDTGQLHAGSPIPPSERRNSCFVARFGSSRSLSAAAGSGGCSSGRPATFLRAFVRPSTAIPFSSRKARTEYSPSHAATTHHLPRLRQT